MAAYTVVAVDEKVENLIIAEKPMNKYRMTLRNSDNREMTGVEWLRLAASKPPTVGQQLNGTVEIDPKWGPKFKASQQGGGGGGYGRGAGKSPSEQASIAASVALDKAIKAAEQALTISAAKVPTSVEEHAALINDYFQRFFVLIDAKAKAA